MPLDATPAYTVEQLNCLALADFIEDNKLGFTMEYYFIPDECGTAGCIAGHAAILWPDISHGRMANPNLAAQKLGLSIEQEDGLFTPDGWMKGEITRSQAVAALRRFANTGEIYFDRTE